ncbi:hypothetical protein RhiirC2_715483 [Rhizophagus irregularis]|uniref:Uncharacterized protein n=1 Tax=Rhizophagus irregularis TaxID=588596 RepID=A0A2N1MV23_9GLOM|nr:hypothetical protein RhiirC2_715483 [Rhizophagus irregularis]
MPFRTTKWCDYEEGFLTAMQFNVLSKNLFSPILTMAKVVKRQHASYFVEQKRVVVIYTLQHRRNSAAKHFEFNTTMLTGFMKRYKFSFTVTYKNISKTSKANNRIIGKFSSMEPNCHQFAFSKENKCHVEKKYLLKNLLEEIIIRSFKKCGISNELDGSEDDVIYEEIDEIIKEIQDENEKEELEIIDINEDKN